MPILLSDKFALYGIQNFKTNWTIFIFFFILIILFTIIFIIIYLKLKQKRALNQIHSITNDQKLVLNTNNYEESKPTTSNVKNEKGLGETINFTINQIKNFNNSQNILLDKKNCENNE